MGSPHGLLHQTRSAQIKQILIGELQPHRKNLQMARETLSKAIDLVKAGIGACVWGCPKSITNRLHQIDYQSNVVTKSITNNAFHPCILSICYFGLIGVHTSHYSIYWSYNCRNLWPMRGCSGFIIVTWPSGQGPTSEIGLEVCVCVWEKWVFLFLGLQFQTIFIAVSFIQGWHESWLTVWLVDISQL